MTSAAARTLSLPGVDTSARSGPTLTLSVTFRYGVSDIEARHAIEAARAALERALDKAGTPAEVSTARLARRSSAAEKEQAP